MCVYRVGIVRIEWKYVYVVGYIFQSVSKAALALAKKIHSTNFISGFKKSLKIQNFHGHYHFDFHKLVLQTKQNTKKY